MSVTKIKFKNFNCQKCVEIVFTDRMSRSQFNPLSVLDDISRVTSVKIHGVTITNKLPASEHVGAKLLPHVRRCRT